MTEIPSTGTISGMRKQYDGSSDMLTIANLVSRDPYLCFKNWFEVACNTKGIGEPNAMTLATATRDGRPSARVVLLKDYNENGFQWFTNYESRKGKELEENPNAALCFYWCNMTETDGKHWARQVRVEGKVVKVSEEKSTEYYISRPKASQIGAAVSQQSVVIPNRMILNDKVKELENCYKVCDHLPKPDNWGGYLLKPERYEFWQGASNRLHDRILFRQPQDGETINQELTHIGDNGWLIERLSP